MLAGVPQGPPDPILGLTEAFKADTFDKKVNLGVGAYRNHEGKPWILPSVKKAQERILDSVNHEYLPMRGLDELLVPSLKLAYGEKLSAGGNIAAVQCLSGTGGLRIGYAFAARFLGKDTKCLIPSPTWPNHKNVIRDCGMEFVEHAYYEPVNKAVDIQGFLKDLQNAPAKSVLLLHGCAHNPTGADPSKEDWKKLADLCK